jgi:hypothetical protein
MNHTDLSNDELLAGVHTLARQGRVVLARLLVYLGEVEERRLDLRSAYSSLFDFCLRRLGLSDDEACRRVAAARLVRRFPAALGMLERGEIHLTGLLMLRDHLTPERGEELLRAACGKSKRELQHLLAQLLPRPDVPSRIQVLSVDGKDAADVSSSPQSMGRLPAPPRSSSTELLFPPSRIEPLAPARYRVEFTAGAELKLKIERAADLMRHTHPSGDLSVLVERAIDLLLAKLEKQRVGKVARPRPPSSRSTRPGYVPRAVRRAVFERDGERCTFVDASGRRCESRTLLELDHGVPRARGGPDDAGNLSVKCRAHNLLSAEDHFGREHVEQKKNGRGQFGARDTGDHTPANGSAGAPAIGDHAPANGSAGAPAIGDHAPANGSAAAPAIGDPQPASGSARRPATGANLASAGHEPGKAGAGDEVRKATRASAGGMAATSPFVPCVTWDSKPVKLAGRSTSWSGPEARHRHRSRLSCAERSPYWPDPDWSPERDRDRAPQPRAARGARREARGRGGAKLALWLYAKSFPDGDPPRRSPPGNHAP